MGLSCATVRLPWQPTANGESLESAVSEGKRLPARATLAERGDPLRQSRTLISGFMIHYIDDLEGQRQVVAFTSPATPSTFMAIRSKRSITRSLRHPTTR